MPTNWEKSQQPDKYFLNEKSGRYCKIDGKRHRHMLKAQNAVNIDGTPIVEATPLQAELVNTAAEVVEDNIAELQTVVHDPAELDDMLKRLLIDKLCGSKQPKTKAKAKKRKAKTKKRKKRIRVVTPPPSSSESESESETE